MALVSKVFSFIRIRGSHTALSIFNPSGAKIFSVNTTLPDIISDAPLTVEGTIAFNSSIEGAIFQAASISSAVTLDPAQSGTLFNISQSSAYSIILPPPTGGLNYKFLLTSPGAFAVDITGSGPSLTGTIVDGAPSVSSFSGLTTMTFIASTAALGDSIDFYAVESTWFVRAFSSISGGITAT